MRHSTHLVADLTLIGIIALCLALAGCGDNDRGEGPLERAGEATDRAAERTGEAIEDGARATGRGIERAGEKIQDKTDG